jgi:Protein of unknown function (DUF3300)
MRIADIMGVQLRPPERGERAVRSVIGIVLGLLVLAAAPVRESAAQAPATAPAASLPAASLPAPSAPTSGEQAAVTAAPVFKMEEIDQLMAPIALYPDDLLVQILTAATYPLEIVMAARWVADPKNAALKGDALEQALQAQSWDPSVKSLVPFPDVLKLMSDKLEWTQKLGDAFLEQEQDCFASIQRLRQRAQSAGKLTSTKQQTVTTQGPAIVIAPADPDVVYVPAYDPGSPMALGPTRTILPTTIRRRRAIASPPAWRPASPLVRVSQSPAGCGAGAARTGTPARSTSTSIGSTRSTRTEPRFPPIPGSTIPSTGKVSLIGTRRRASGLVRNTPAPGRDTIIAAFKPPPPAERRQRGPVAPSQTGPAVALSQIVQVAGQWQTVPAVV